jgi:hypothetical protein
MYWNLDNFCWELVEFGQKTTDFRRSFTNFGWKLRFLIQILPILSEFWLEIALFDPNFANFVRILENSVIKLS